MTNTHQHYHTLQHSHRQQLRLNMHLYACAHVCTVCVLSVACYPLWFWRRGGGGVGCCVLVFILGLRLRLPQGWRWFMECFPHILSIILIVRLGVFPIRVHIHWRRRVRHPLTVGRIGQLGERGRGRSTSRHTSAGKL